MRWFQSLSHLIYGCHIWCGFHHPGHILQALLDCLLQELTPSSCIGKLGCLPEPIKNGFRNGLNHVPTFYKTIWLVMRTKFGQAWMVCEPSKPRLKDEMSHGAWCFHYTCDRCLRCQGLWLEECCVSCKVRHSTGWSEHSQQQWKKQPVSQFQCSMVDVPWNQPIHFASEAYVHFVAFANASSEVLSACAGLLESWKRGKSQHENVGRVVKPWSQWLTTSGAWEITRVVLIDHYYHWICFIVEDSYCCSSLCWIWLLLMLSQNIG